MQHLGVAGPTTMENATLVMIDYKDKDYEVKRMVGALVPPMC